MGQNIFISYRRVDTEGYAGRIYDRLAERFGAERVFMDVTDIEVGEDFSDAIGQAISSCRVVIVLMGPRWHTVSDGMGRKRLDDPHDFVHIEVKSALDQEILVIPVLVHGAEMPRKNDLPFDLAGLMRRNAIEIRHRRFEIDVENLITELEGHFDKSDRDDVGYTEDKPHRRIPIWGWVLIFILLITLGIFGINSLRNNTDTPIPRIQNTEESTLIAIAELDVKLPDTNTSQPPTESTTELPSATMSLPTITNSPTASLTPSLTPITTPLASLMTDPHGVSMVLVPQGPFIMGTDGRDPWNIIARPARLVSLDMYYIDKYEISNSQYAECVFDGACDVPMLTRSKLRHLYYGNSFYADFPVVYVTWSDAQSYCGWRSGRLPSEAEWEKAARGDDQRGYPWGTEQVDCHHANYWPTGACEGDTTAVTKQSSGASYFGVYNMSGNVAEWVQDWFQAYPGGDSHAANDFGITHRTIRGGAYFDGPNNIRVTGRKGMNPEEAHSYVGFRCVIDIEALP